MSVPPPAGYPKQHIPNFYMSKVTSRRDEALLAIINDDSNIEYNNIFPKILSKNRKIAVNVSLERQMDRKDIIDGKDKGGGADAIYHPVYNLIDKKIKVPSLGVRRNSQRRNQNVTQNENGQIKIATDGGNLVNFTFEDPIEGKELRGLD